MVKVLDKEGNEQDWDWVVENYGQVYVESAEGPAYRLVQVTEVEGITVFTCSVLNEAGGPVAGIPVAYIWPGGQSNEITNPSGVAEHTAGGGEQYKPWEQQGPISWQVQGAASERVVGLGWIFGSNHRHLQVTMQWKGEDVPEPPEDGLDDILERVDRFLDQVDRFLDMLEVVWRI